MNALLDYKTPEEKKMHKLVKDYPYQVGKNESGYLNMLIAENKISWDMISKKIK